MQVKSTVMLHFTDTQMTIIKTQAAANIVRAEAEILTHTYH